MYSSITISLESIFSNKCKLLLIKKIENGIKIKNKVKGIKKLILNVINKVYIKQVNKEAKVPGAYLILPIPNKLRIIFLILVFIF